MHLIGVDFEDWYLDVENCRDPGPARLAFARQVDRIVDILHDTGVRGTFFLLGKTAERYPDIVKLVAAGGHELASHGYGHERIDRMDRDGFRKDVERSVDVIERVAGQRPVGYRAPYFSYTGEEWFYPTLEDTGFLYSSSVMPAKGLHSGLPDHDPAPGPVAGSKIWEIPVAVAEVFGRRVPAAGGGFWRVLPWSMIAWSAGQLERRGRPFAGYMHPHEFDQRPLRSPHGVRRNMFVNAGRASVANKFRRMCQTFGGSRFIDYVASARK